MTNGSFASYEANNLETGKTNSWYGEYYRLECEGGAAVLDRDHIVRIEERSAAGTLQTREVPPVQVIWEGHQAVAAQFLDWLDGGAPPATTLADNLESTAMLFTAVRASETGKTVNVQEMVRQLASWLSSAWSSSPTQASMATGRFGRIAQQGASGRGGLADTGHDSGASGASITRRVRAPGPTVPSERHLSNQHGAEVEFQPN